MKQTTAFLALILSPLNSASATNFEELKTGSEFNSESMPHAGIEVSTPAGALLESAGSARSAYVSGVYTGETLVISGKEVRVDTELPKGLKCGSVNGIEIACSEGLVREIIVQSPAAHLSRTFAAVDKSTLEEILRFYGKPDRMERKDASFVLKYPRSGVDFEVDRDTERLKKITVYIPVR